jgi:ABC-type multidrug transport system permease subunit
MSRAGIVLGKWMARLVLALVQIGFALAAGTFLFNMDWGSSLPAVGVLLAAWAAFNATFSILLGSVARSQGQAAGLGVVTSMALGALGGCWWPIEIVPAWMQKLALFLPSGWAMNGMHKLVSFGAPSLAVVPNVAAILAGTLVLGFLATRYFRYE